MYTFLKDRMKKMYSVLSTVKPLIIFTIFGSGVLLTTFGNADILTQNVVNQEITNTVIVEGREAEFIHLNTVQGRFKFTTEIANTPEKTQSGLMFRESMPHNHGMLFNFHLEKEVFMWMKNTPLSLDMVFLSPKGRVVSIVSNTTPFSENVISSKKFASGVLEINAGTSKLIGLKAGDLLEHRSFDQENNGVLKEKAN